MLRFFQPQDKKYILFVLFSILVLAGCGKKIHFSSKNGETTQGETSLNVTHINGFPSNITEQDCAQTIYANECLIVKKNGDNYNSQLFFTPNIAADMKDGPVAFIVPIQPFGIGPQKTFHEQNEIFQEKVGTELKIKLMNKNGTGFYDVFLFAQRYLGYGFNSSINNFATFYTENQAALFIDFDKEKNIRLPVGIYFGEFEVLAVSETDKKFSKKIKVKVLLEIN
ncbi:hypothetical protein QEJ31_01930 [Pigmentibacter sp. JX0631]|uniref:hypothetical protein n=1 Tax=Pigmentibacter sp. JX0631 TaxID=2976982 RepID=UPI002468B6E0|nr:hypothetical protein [Pigmentibacter sp. JX0631]WGL60362.1 hypothetical protein QEJ31_01930 [Pigmentibacter sp. JX0631]